MAARHDKVCLALVTKAIYFATLILAAAALGQSTTSDPDPLRPAIRSTSTLVIVPTLVRSASGDFVTNLRANDFRLTDNGIEQKVFAEEMKGQAIAVVVLMQTGGAAPIQFQNYQTVSILLNHLLESSNHKVALVTFDSRPEEVWNFPPQVDGLKYAFTNHENGDHGAAILDGLNRGIDMLEQQPPSFSRIIVLLSQPHDEGSRSRAEDVVRRLGENNITVYSVTFPPDKAHPSKDRTNPMEAINPSGSLEVALKGIRKNTADALAALSGGQHVHLKDKRDLEDKLSILEEELSHSYTLSFQPTLKDPGFHTINVEVTKDQARFLVSARTSYWVRDTATEK
jgi:VWFA-related protein